MRLQEFAVLFAMLQPQTKQFVQVVTDPKFTRNLFGPIDEIAGKRLEVLERNERGDCVCLFVGKLGQNIVDVDHQDIAAVQELKP